MLSKIKLRIMIKAVEIRIDNGEEIDDILSSYPKLTDDDKAYIKAAIIGGDSTTTTTE